MSRKHSYQWQLVTQIGVNSMDRSEVIKLVKKDYVKDENGVMQASETVRTVFCDIKSASASEWFEGGRNGLNPAYTMTMFEPDYNGEDVVIYNNVRYSVYRTYRSRNELLELHVQKEVGA